MKMTERKLTRKFRKYIKRYHSFCKSYGYTSGELKILIKFLHHIGFKTNKDLIRRESNYFLIYKEDTFNLGQLILIFEVK